MPSSPLLPKNIHVCIIGLGFIGRSILNALLPHNFVTITVVNRSEPADLPKSVNYLSYDDFLQSLLGNVQLTYGVVYICTGGSYPSQKLYEATHTTSTDHEYLLVQLLMTSGVTPRIVYPSSSAVYGEQYTLPIGETADTTPISNYGKLKLSIELMIKSLSHITSYTIFRISNPYGDTRGKSRRQGIIDIIKTAYLASETVSIRGPHTVRDFIHIDDLTDAMTSLVKSTDKYDLTYNQTINLGSQTGVSISELCAKIDVLTESRVKYVIEANTSYSVEIASSILSNQKAQKLLSWHCDIPIDLGLKRLFGSDISLSS